MNDYVDELLTKNADDANKWCSSMMDIEPNDVANKLGWILRDGLVGADGWTVQPYITFDSTSRSIHWGEQILKPGELPQGDIKIWVDPKLDRQLVADTLRKLAEYYVANFGDLSAELDATAKRHKAELEKLLIRAKYQAEDTNNAPKSETVGLGF